MKKPSKTLVVLSACACAAASVGIFAACGDDSAHTAHDYGDWVVTNPGDETEGSAVKICKKEDCDEKVTVTLPVLSDGAYTVNVDGTATCVVAGETSYTLPNDGDPISFVVVTPATGHGALEYAQAGTPSLHKASTEAHWRCLDCGQLFSDADGTTEIEAVVTIPAEHPLAYVKESDATCTGTGVTAHYYCEACEKYYGDESGENELTADEFTIPASGHSCLYVKGTAATCYTEGEKEHYHCNVCEKDFEDAKGENELADLTIAALEHELKKVEGRAATCTVNGFEEYWECGECNDMFRDGDGAQKLDLIQTIPAIGSHDWSEYPVYNAEKGCVALQCAVCHAEKDEIKCEAVSTGSLTGGSVKLGETYYVYKVYTAAANSVTIGMQNYVLSEIGVYEVSFVYLDDRAYSPGINTRTGAINSKVIFSGDAEQGYTVNDVFKNNVTAQFDGYGRLTKLIISVDGVAIAQEAKLMIAVTGGSVEAGETRGCLISVKNPGKLYYGANTVGITAAGAAADDSDDIYTFVSEEDKTYSLTVPAGVSAILSTGVEVDGGESGAYINFDAVMNQPIRITFLAPEIGSYNVTIGEMGAYVITLADPLSVNMLGRTVIEIKLGDDVVAGKEYKITFGGSFILTKIRGAGYWWFKINGENSYEAMNSDTATGFQVTVVTDTGTTEGEEKSWDYTKSRDELSVTFIAGEGDTIYLAIQDGSIPEGETTAELVLTITEVTEED